MHKKSIIISSVIALIAFTSIFLFLKSQKTTAPGNIYSFVPPSTPLFMTIKNPVDVLEIRKQNELLASLANSSIQPAFFQQLDSLSSYLTNNESLTDLFANNELLISLQYTGKDDITPLLMMALNTKKHLDLASKMITLLQADTTFQNSNRKYNKTNIHLFTAGEKAFQICVHNDVLLISTRALLIEDVIRQLEVDQMVKDQQLDQLMKTVDRNADLNLFLNHKTAGPLLQKFCNTALKNKLNSLKTYGDWSELDLSFSKQKVLMSGFTSTNQAANLYANVLNKQVPVDLVTERFLPHETAFYYNLGISDFSDYFKDYEDYLEKRNLFFPWQEKITKMEAESGMNILDFLIEYGDKAVCSAGISIDQNHPNSGKIFVLHTKSGSSAMSALMEMKNRYIARKQVNKSEWEESYKIDDQTIYHVHRFPFPDFAKHIFGQQFNNTKTNWFAQYDNFIVFGDSYRTVAKALHANTLGETLASNLAYNKFKSNLNTKSNITFYVNPASTMPVANLFFNEPIAERIREDENLRKFKSFGFQVSATGAMLYNNVCLYYDPVIKTKPQTIWQSHMNDRFDFKPQFVINHYDRFNKEIMLQDNSNTLYLINNIGRILWQLKLDGQLKGDIHQVDIFRNGKFQYLMNTENKLYLIDRNGNNVGKFPVNLSHKATNGVAVFDYDLSRDYRFFIACADQKIYAYDATGDILQGWNQFKTDHPVLHPLQHIRTEGKDFIIAHDKVKDYLLHRRGTIREKTDAVYNHSKNNQMYYEEASSSHDARIVATDNEGAQHYTYFDGRHEIINNINVSEDHHFLSADLNNDGEYEYLFVDGKEVKLVNNKGKVLLKKKFDYPISHQANLYTFSNNNIKIGLTSAVENKIYLFDINGTSHPGFPLAGSTEFSIGFISDERSNFNLLVGSPDGYLYNYYVE